MAREALFLVEDVVEMAEKLIDMQHEYHSTSYDSCSYCGGRYHYPTKKRNGGWYDCSPDCVIHIAYAVLTGYK